MSVANTSVNYQFLEYQGTKVNYSFMLEKEACKAEERRVKYLFLESQDKLAEENK